ELILGPLEKIGPACDIYLLGAMLFEIVTGESPHSFQTMGLQTAAKKMTEIRRVVCENIIRPTDHIGELVDIARKAMATKPEDRYPSVVEMQAAIREYQKHAASRHLEERARELTAPPTGAGPAMPDQPSPSYASYQNALTLFTESLREWSGNYEAREGLTETQLQLAQLALRNGDFDLGLSVLDTNAETHVETRTLLVKAREEREGRVRRMKLLKIAASALAVSLVIFLAVAARLQFNLTAAIAKADKAVELAKEAGDQAKKADEAKAKAEEVLVATNQKLTTANEDIKVANDKIDVANTKIEVAKKNLEEAGEKLELANNEVKAANQKAVELDIKVKDANENLKLAQDNLKKTQDEFAVKQAEFKQELGVAQERTEKANYLAGLAEANRFVQEGRYSDARRKLQILKKYHTDRCKAEWDQLWSTVNAAQAVSLAKPVESIGLSRDGRLLAAA
ncbi:MAG TPA: hypothetical protein VK137_11975, partial [Planctomycetaceae bacterium]|nr:hypothetical protein [Planctomycetaceae bacterium]